MATPNIVPRADSEGGLGTASKYWASAYIDFVYVGAGKIGRDADNLIDFSVDNNIVFKVNGASELQLNADEFFPYTSNGLSLGNSSRMWSDLFLADGAVINFDNGEVTMTHSGSGDFTIDVADDIRFDAGGGDIVLRAGGTEYGRLSNSSGDFVIKNITADKDIIFQADDNSGSTETYFFLDGSANVDGNPRTKFPDNSRLMFGAGSDMDIFHNGTDSFIRNNTTSGDLIIQQSGADKDIIFNCDNGSGSVATYLTLDGSEGHITVQKEINFQNNVLARFGTNNASQIYHNGTDMLIENNIGDTKISNYKQDKDIIFQGDDGQASDNTVTTYFYLDGSSAAHNGSATTALYTNWPDNSRISLGTSHDLTIHHSGTSSAIANAVGHLEFIQSADGSDIKFYCDNGSGGITEYFRLDGGLSSPHTIFPDGTHIALGNSVDLAIYHDSANSYISQNGTGSLILQHAVADGDIIFKADDGTGTVTPYLTLDGGATKVLIHKEVDLSSHLSLVDSAALNFGNANDLQIYHDGSNSYISDTGTGSLLITGANDVNLKTDTNERMVQANANGSVQLFYDNVEKLATSSAGVNVAGIINAANLNLTDTDGGNMIILDSSSGDGIIRWEDNDVQKWDIGRDNTDQAFVISNEAGLNDNQIVHINHSTSEFTLKGALTVGADDTGHDVKFYGATTVHYAMWDQSKDLFQVSGDLEIKNANGSNPADAGSLVFNEVGTTWSSDMFGFRITLEGSANELKIQSANTSTVKEILKFARDTATSTFSGPVTVGADDTGHDVIFYGATSSRYLQWDESQDSLRLRDNVKMKAGNDGDLEIYHDGSNSYIVDSGTGDMLNYYSNDWKLIKLGSGELSIWATTDAGVKLYYDNSLKLETTSGGVDIAGSVTATSYKAGSATILQGDADVILGSSGGTGTISLTTHSSTPFKIENDDTISISSDVSITSTAASAVGGGFDGAETATIQIGEVNQEIITTIQIDLGTGGATDIVSSGTAGDVIGENDTAAAFITKYDSTKSGVLYKAELICLETPAGGDTDINLVLNATSLAEDAAGEAEGHVIVDGGAQTIGMRTESTASVVTAAAGAHNDYIYLTHGGTTAGTYSAGKFLIRLYGAKATL